MLDLLVLEVFDCLGSLVHIVRSAGTLSLVLDVTPHVDFFRTPRKTQTEVKSGAYLIKTLAFLQGSDLFW